MHLLLGKMYLGFLTTNIGLDCFFQSANVVDTFSIHWTAVNYIFVKSSLLHSVVLYDAATLNLPPPI